MSRAASPRHPAIRILPVAAVLLGFQATGLGAASLPMHRYTTADGLPTDTVTELLVDRRGFLWVGTLDGLARFDFDRFEVFDDRHGLPGNRIDDLLESRDGSIHVVTDRGMARLSDLPGPRASLFVPVAPPAARTTDVRDLELAPDGSLLAATSAGLFSLPPPPAGSTWRRIAVDPGGSTASDHDCTFVFVDRRNDVWTECSTWLVRVTAGGGVDRWDLQREALVPPSMWIMGMGEDAAGRLWLAGSGFLYLLKGDPRPGAVIVERDYGACVYRQPRVFGFLRRRDGSFWLATGAGPVALREEPPDASCPFDILYEHGDMFRRSAPAMAEDEAGNLWISEGSHGLVRLASRGFTYYDRRDGLAHPEVNSFAEGPAGELVALGGPPDLRFLDGESFVPIFPAVPEGTPLGWGSSQRMLFDREGAFWIATRSGLMRWSPVDRVARLDGMPPSRVYMRDEGIFRVFEDSRGDLWFGPEEGGPSGTLCRWKRSADTIDCFGKKDGVSGTRVRAMVEDRAGNVWIGFRDGSLLRWQDGAPAAFGEREGLRAGEITSLLADRTGSLWVAAPRQGVFRIQPVKGGAWKVSLLGRDAGLSSTDARCLVEDASGRIYVGTSRGIDRIDPDTGHVHPYAGQDGLLNTSLSTAFRARDGALWFGTADGAARLIPRPDPAPAPPRVYLMGVRVAGEAHPMPPRGAAALDEVSLDPAQRNVEIEYTGISHHPGERLRFQTRLEGAETQWSEPSPRRSVSYARLAPGSYRFLVRAVNADGVTSATPASLPFQVASPIWQRGWFLALATVLMGAVAVLFHRQRAARLVELERVRTRIATDLHDEVGAGLSEIALMGEVWARHPGEGHPPGDGIPRRIAVTSRRLVDAMSDIVWAVNPEKDHVFSLSQRMRRFATGYLRSAGIALRFHSIDEAQDRALDGDARRELLLAFQETVANAVRHAGCTTLDVRLECPGGELVMSVADDGRGFDPTVTSSGTGLSSLRVRAERLGGRCVIASTPSGGTTVTLRIPLTPRRRGRRAFLSLPGRGGAGGTA